METSSPLASLQPNHPGQFNRPAISFAGSCNYNAPAFNFKDMSMLRPQARPDYFTFNPARGSSPTASLAADLSQNFHIDQRFVPPHPTINVMKCRPTLVESNSLPLISPQLPTPRRNLFNGPATGFGGSRMSYAQVVS